MPSRTQGRIWPAVGGLGLKAGVLGFSCIWYLPLVSESCLVQASWRAELMTAHWWLELSLGSLLGKAMPRAMFRGSSMLRKSLGSLSTNGLSFVPAQLVVCPGAYRLFSGSRSWH